MNVIKTSCQMKHVSKIRNLQSPQNVLFFKLFSAMILRFINALVKKNCTTQVRNTCNTFTLHKRH